MLDINLIRSNTKMVKENLRRRGKKEYLEMLDELLKKDKEWRDLKTRNQKLQHSKHFCCLFFQFLDRLFFHIETVGYYP